MLGKRPARRIVSDPTDSHLLVYAVQNPQIKEPTMHPSSNLALFPPCKENCIHMRSWWMQNGKRARLEEGCIVGSFI
jgi:hypothetical protein